jgi:hypothetical protein
VERREASWLFGIYVVDVPGSQEPKVVGSVSVFRERIVQLEFPLHPYPFDVIARAFVQSHFPCQEFFP